MNSVISSQISGEDTPPFPSPFSPLAIITMADYEKNEVVYLERTTSDDSTVDDRLNSLTAEEQKKLIWRIDTRLVLTLGFMVSDSEHRCLGGDSANEVLSTASPSWIVPTWVLLSSLVWVLISN